MSHPRPATQDLVVVDVAQLVEHWTVAPVVAGSNPVIHPIPSHEIRRPVPSDLAHERVLVV